MNDFQGEADFTVRSRIRQSSEGGKGKKKYKRKYSENQSNRQKKRTQQLHFKRIRGQSSLIVVRKCSLLGREDDWSQYFVL